MNRLNAMRAADRYAQELWNVLLECDMSTDDTTAVCHDRNRILFELYGTHPYGKAGWSERANTGIKYDTDDGPCACGAWHDCKRTASCGCVACWAIREQAVLSSQLASAKKVITAARVLSDDAPEITDRAKHWRALANALRNYDAKHGAK